MVDPKNFACPITRLIMTDPVDTVDGQSYEREEIEKWLRSNSTSPVTGKFLESKDLRPNMTLKRIITDYLAKNKNLYEQDEVYLSEKLLTKLKNEIIDHDLDAVKFKLSTYSDYRYFTQDLNNSNSGYSAFYAATEVGSREIAEEILEYLIRTNLIDKIKTKPKFWSPEHFLGLFRNIVTGDLTDIKKSKMSALINLDFNYLDHLIQLSFESNSEEIAKWLIENDKVSIESKDKNGNTLLIISAAFNSENLFNFLVKQKADLNASNYNNENSFYFSIKNNNESIFNTIIDNLNIEIPSNLKVLKLIDYALDLSMIYYPNNLDLIQKLIDLDKNFMIIENENKQTPLFIACELNNLEAVKILLKNNANLNHTDANDENCLHIAVRNENRNIIDLLIDNGINGDLVNVQGKTPLDLASRPIKNFITNKNSQFLNMLRNRIHDLEKNQAGFDRQNLINRIEKLETLNRLSKNRFVACGRKDGLIEIWNLETGQAVKYLNGYSAYVWKLELMSNGYLISCSQDTKVKIWNLNTGDCVKSLDGHKSSVYTIKLFDRNYLFTGSADATIKLWNLETGECQNTYSGHSDSVTSLEIILNENLISASSDKTIKIWNIKTGECLNTFIGHTQGVQVIKLMGNNQLISASIEKKIKIWDISSNCLLRDIDLSETSEIDLSDKLQLSDFVLLTDSTIACCFKGGKSCILIYNFEEESVKRVLEGHLNDINQIDLISNKYLISCSSDKTVKIWNLDNWSCIKTIESTTNDKYNKISKSEFISLILIE